MKVASICVGVPREVQWQGKTVSTGIFKSQVEGPVRVRMLNLDGDEQADLTVHGGEHKAVYTYAAEYYDWWRTKLAQPELGFGAFGENFTTVGLDETTVCVGDRFRFGGCVLEAAQPRMPCFKLGIRFNDPSILKTFLDSGRLGIYFRVVDEGMVATGDGIEKIFAHPAQLPVFEVRALTKGPLQKDKVTELLTLKTLCPRIRQKLETRLQSK
ncbi:MAG: MOSC domain-containing protein [Deltaproteobacteria bacterium]|nr:MOSC domain-containing protein [Deltaproteobacteria bacterium]